MFQGSDQLYESTDQVFSIVECTHCALIRLLPQPTLNELTRYYPTKYWWKTDETLLGKITEFYRKITLWDHVRFITASPRSTGPILDIGSGGGSLVRALRKHGIPAAGLDNSQVAARMTGSDGSPAVCATLPNIPFMAQSFSAITMFHVLEHVTDPVACISAARQLLRPGGKLFIQVPNAASWQFLLLGQHWSALDIPRHLIHFRANDIEELLRDCGFRILRRKFFSLRDNPASLATSLFPNWEPVVRTVRGTRESTFWATTRSFLYLILLIFSLPFTLWEAAAMAGSTVLLEAVLDEDS